MAELEKQLQEEQSYRMKLIISDGVFSMDGNITPLRSALLETSLADICHVLAERYLPLAARYPGRCSSVSSVHKITCRHLLMCMLVWSSLLPFPGLEQCYHNRLQCDAGCNAMQGALLRPIIKSLH